MNAINNKNIMTKIGKGIVHCLFSLFIVLSSIWLCLAIWYQQPLGNIFSIILIIAWIIFACSILGIYITQHLFSRTKDFLIYCIIFALSLVWYFNIPALQNRQWDPEVDHILTFEKQGNIVTLHNVRNFNWRTETDYDVHWETRTVNLDHITGVNIINSYWMGPQIAHTLVSFNFKDSKPITFSLEIRKEKGESFSTFGGFFRKFELSLIAADEKDIIYTRSNARGEQVYFFPVKMPEQEMKALFEQYLSKASDLQENAKWYNTLTSNCTTLVFDMVQAISPFELPIDYRLIASGYLPNYLYDLNALSHDWNMKEWYEHSHINPRVKGKTNLSSEQYSLLIREGLPNIQIAK